MEKWINEQAEKGYYVEHWSYPVLVEYLGLGAGTSIVVRRVRLDIFTPISIRENKEKYE